MTPAQFIALWQNNLYNARPAWLDNAHKTLDAAVDAAYGWADYTPAMPGGNPASPAGAEPGPRFGAGCVAAVPPAPTFHRPPRQSTSTAPESGQARLSRSDDELSARERAAEQ